MLLAGASHGTHRFICYSPYPFCDGAKYKESLSEKTSVNFIFLRHKSYPKMQTTKTFTEVGLLFSSIYRHIIIFPSQSFGNTVPEISSNFSLNDTSYDLFITICGTCFRFTGILKVRVASTLNKVLILFRYVCPSTVVVMVFTWVVRVYPILIA